MNPFKHTYYISLLAIPALLFASCSQDEVLSDIGATRSADDDTVDFVATLPGVTSRSTYDVDKEFLKSGISISAFCDENAPAADGILKVHCEDAIAKQNVDGVFRSDNCRWPGNRGEKKDGRLRFFAFHPSRAEMKKLVGNAYFGYSNNTTKDGSNVSYDYRLTKFRVASDISRQVDFVTAIGEGNKTEHLYSDIKLNFEHQLSGVEVSAWGAATLYDIEVAGWRVGGIFLEADFGLSTVVANRGENDNTIGEWFINNDSRGYVDYVFAPNDKVVRINAAEHNTKETAVSLLGGGGRALLIPQTQDMWDYKNNRTGTPKGIYFSALVRITQHDGDNHCIYPSKDPQSADYIVFLSVLKSDGTVMKRLDKNGNIYGTSTKYNIPATEELRYYGWAAAPAKVDWKAGYTYHYILDYTNGVGVHDPYDPNRASPVVDWGGVGVTTTTGNWGDGETIKVVGDIGKDYTPWGANSNNTAPDGTVWWK